MDIRLVHLDGVVLQGEHVVGEDNSFVSSPFMIMNQKLGGAEFVRVHHVQKLKINDRLKHVAYSGQPIAN